MRRRAAAGPQGLKGLHRLRGLTLIEVVVAMAVLSLVVLVLGASLRGVARSAQRIDERVERIDGQRVAVAFLREVLARLPDEADRPPAQPSQFVAAPASLQWVAVMPVRFGAAGRHRFRLALEPADDDGPHLVLRLLPWRADDAAPDWAAAEARVLARRVAVFELRYGGEGLDGEGWRADWPPDARRPPPRLKFDLAATGAADGWPTVVLPVHVASARGGRPRFVVGGTAP